MVLSEKMLATRFYLLDSPACSADSKRFESSSLLPVTLSLSHSLSLSLSFPLTLSLSLSFTFSLSLSLSLSLALSRPGWRWTKPHLRNTVTENWKMTENHFHTRSLSTTGKLQ